MIACKNCGTFNPDDSDFCSYCSAELASTALEPVPDQSEAHISSDQELHDDDGMIPGWLQDLDIPENNVEADDQRTAPDDTPATVPGWLAGVEVKNRSEQVDASDDNLEKLTLDSESGHTPDWLHDLEDPTPGRTRDAEEQGTKSTPGLPGMPDWLANIDLGLSETAGGPSDSSAGAEIAESPAWLAAASFAAKERPATGEEALTGPTGEATSATTERKRESTLEADVAASEMGPDPAGAGSPMVDAPAIEDERETTTFALSDAPEQGQSLPDWLQGVNIAAIRAAMVGVTPITAPASAVQVDGASEESLATISPTEPVTGEADPADRLVSRESVAGTAPDTDDETESIEPAAGEATVAAGEQEDFDSWLQALAVAAALRGREDVVQEPVDDREAREAVLAEIDQFFGEASTTESEQLALGEPLPEWLDEVLQVAGAAFVSEIADAIESLSQSSEETDTTGQTPDESISDWLHDETSLSQPLLEADERRRFGAVGAAAVVGGPKQAQAGVEVPITAPSGEPLLMGDFPEWLEAMRRADLLSGEPYETEWPVAESGPLAGIEGVLEIEPTILQLQTAEGSASQPGLTPEQRQQAALLQQLTHEEQVAQVKTTHRRESVLPTSVQLIMAALLLIAISAGLLFPAPVEVEPPNAPAALNVHQAIAAAAEQPVLVAFEYSPAMAGELSPQAEMILSDLAANNSTALLVSQSPAGITLAEDLAPLVPGLSSVSVGYLAGEAVGLRQLANCMSGQPECAALNGGRIDESLLDQLSKAALLVVIAAERDGLVSWIEQVGSSVDIPLVAGVTQAVAPIAAPYHKSGQLQGVIAGLPAAAAYEQASQQSENGAANPTFNGDRLWAFTLAQWTVILLLILGNVFWLVISLLRRKEGR